MGAGCRRIEATKRPDFYVPQRHGRFAAARLELYRGSDLIDPIKGNRHATRGILDCRPYQGAVRAESDGPDA